MTPENPGESPAAHPSPAGPGSLWLDGWREPDSDPLPDDARFDVLVVGAGLTGLTTALLLAGAGRRVGVVEARHVGAVTTGHTTAKVALLQGTKLSRLSRLQPRAAVASYLDANREGQAWLARFCAEHGVDVQHRDAVTYAASPAEVRAVRREHETAAALGLPVAWYDALDTPFPLHGATVLPDQLQLDPMALLDALVEEVRAHGGTLHQGRRVVSVGKTGSPTVRLADGVELHADHLVLATGTPILDRGLHFAKVEPKRSYLLAFTGGTPPDRMYLSAGRSARSVRDAPPDHLLVGGSGHTVGRTGSAALHLTELREWARRYFPGAVETHAWSAQDYRPYAGSPLVDALPGSGGRILVATGFDKWGMTSGVAAALALAGRILDGATVDFDGGGTGPRPLASALGINSGVGVAQGRGLLRSLLDPPLRPAEVDGRRCRLLTVCSHLGGVLRWNDAEDSWDCPLHGSRFDAAGEVLEGPATRPLRRLR